jgi:hypothetical protein
MIIGEITTAMMPARQGQSRRDRPSAASGVSSTWIRSSPGRTRPIAPSVSATPMNRRNSVGRATGPAIASGATTSFITPANRNNAASRP